MLITSLNRHYVCSLQTALFYPRDECYRKFRGIHIWWTSTLKLKRIYVFSLQIGWNGWFSIRVNLIGLSTCIRVLQTNFVWFHRDLSCEQLANMRWLTWFGFFFWSVIIHWVNICKTKNYRFRHKKWLTFTIYRRWDTPRLECNLMI